MWMYKRRLSVHPIERNVTFAGVRLLIAADGRVLTSIDEALALKMRRAPHIFEYVEDKVVEPAPAPVVEESTEKVETSSVNDDNVTAPRTRKRRKTKDEG